MKPTFGRPAPRHTRPRPVHPNQLQLDQVLRVVLTSTGVPLFVLPGGLVAPEPEPVAAAAPRAVAA